jgi:hypothetical protein
VLNVLVSGFPYSFLCHAFEIAAPQISISTICFDDKHIRQRHQFVRTIHGQPIVSYWPRCADDFFSGKFRRDFQIGLESQRVFKAKIILL